MKWKKKDLKKEFQKIERNIKLPRKKLFKNMNKK